MPLSRVSSGFFPQCADQLAHRNERSSLAMNHLIEQNIDENEQLRQLAGLGQHTRELSLPSSGQVTAGAIEPLAGESPVSAHNSNEIRSVNDASDPESGLLAPAWSRLATLQLAFERSGASSELWGDVQRLYKYLAQLPKTGPINAAALPMREPIELLQARIALSGADDALLKGDTDALLQRSGWVNSALNSLWRATQHQRLQSDEAAQALWGLDTLRMRITERRPFLITVAQEQNSATDEASSEALQRALALQTQVMGLSGMAKEITGVDALFVTGSCTTEPAPNRQAVIPENPSDEARLSAALASGERLLAELDKLCDTDDSAAIGLSLWADEEIFLDEHEALRVQFYESLKAELNSALQDIRNAHAEAVAKHLYEVVLGLDEADSLQELGESNGLQPLFDCAQQIRRSQETGELAYSVEQRFDEVNQIIHEALSVRARDAQLYVQEMLEDILDRCVIEPIDRERIDESLNLLPCLTREWGKSKQQHAKELIQLAQNGTVLFTGLMKQSKLVSQAVHMSALEKSQVISWLCRLAENESALLAPDVGAAQSFVEATEQVILALVSDDALGKRLINHMQTVAHEQACTDWASSVLVELSAVIDSARLEMALAQLKTRAVSPAERQALAVIFVRAHSEQIKSLLRFSAFKAFITESAYAQVGHSEALEQALYLYTRLQQEFVLPGRSAAKRMDYAELAEQVFGKETLENALIEARDAIRLVETGDTNHKQLLLDNLELFGVSIWTDLKGFVPGTAVDAQEPSLAQCDQALQDTMRALEALDTTTDDYLEKTNALSAQYQLWSGRKQIARQEAGPDAKVLRELISAIGAGMR